MAPCRLASRKWQCFSRLWGCLASGWQGHQIATTAPSLASLHTLRRGLLPSAAAVLSPAEETGSQLCFSDESTQLQPYQRCPSMPHCLQQGMAISIPTQALQVFALLAWYSGHYVFKFCLGSLLAVNKHRSGDKPNVQEPIDLDRNRVLDNVLHEARQITTLHKRANTSFMPRKSHTQWLGT